MQKYDVTNKPGNRFNSFYFDEDTEVLFLPATTNEAIMALFDGPKAVVDNKEIFFEINWFKKEYPSDEWGIVEDHIKSEIQKKERETLRPVEFYNG